MLKGLSLLAASQLGSTVMRNLRAMPYFAAGLLLFLVGLGFLIDFAHTWLSLRMGAMAASGILGAVFLTVAGLAVTIGCAIKAKSAAAPNALTASALIAAPVAARIMGGRLRLGTVALAGVVAAGAILGRSLGRP